MDKITTYNNVRIVIFRNFDITSLTLFCYFDQEINLKGLRHPPVTQYSNFPLKKLLTIAAKQTKVDGKAGAICEQALTSMRTVMYFNGQKQEISRYCTHFKFKISPFRYSQILERLDKVGIRYALYTGVWYMLQNMICFPSLGLCIWAGSRMAYYGEVDAGIIISVSLAGKKKNLNW